ncbi:MAG TPA: glycine reductase, partial [Gammaproteobacteria bacterium]|nr:glycine reductase [Gammaproteobacteria bacterium]
QSVGLIARALEAAGIATICLSSARSITESVGAPRAVYLDYPLGQTAGRANNFAEQA